MMEPLVKRSSLAQKRLERKIKRKVKKKGKYIDEKTGRAKGLYIPGSKGWAGSIKKSVSSKKNKSNSKRKLRWKSRYARTIGTKVARKSIGNKKRRRK